MWKWIGGIVLIIILCFAAAIWTGYRKLTADGDAATVTIAGTPERIFAALATHDSLPSWYVLKGQPAPAGHGLIGIGDSLPAQIPQSASRGRKSRWVADTVVPGKLIALSLHTDTAVVAVRRDSLVSIGDSTEIISTISSPLMENVKARNPGGARLIGVSSKLLVSAMRLQSKVELLRLKNHIEGRPVEAVQP